MEEVMRITVDLAHLKSILDGIEEDEDCTKIRLEITGDEYSSELAVLGVDAEGNTIECGRVPSIDED